MKTKSILCIIALSVALSQCRQEDYGPKQSDTRTFSNVGFDRLEITEGFDVTIQQGAVFSITTSGDRRDLNDLEVKKLGTTLSIHYSKGKNRQYIAFITITMPQILGLDLSGGVNARVTGFTSRTERFDASLSGATISQFQISADEVHVLLTGASEGHFSGSGTSIDASVSGASTLISSEYPVEKVELVVAGASKAEVNVSSTLTVSASGASEVLYHGSPQVDSETSGESTVRQN